MTDSERASRENPPRRRYEPPTLMKVGLVADQVLAVGCKLSSGAGAPVNPSSCTLNNCQAAGS